MARQKAHLTSLPTRREETGPRRIIEERGEMAILHPDGPVYNPVYFDIHAGERYFRGGHYHERKTENFFIISGACRIRHVDVDSGEEGVLVAAPGDLITIAPRCAHVLEAIQFCRVVEFSTQEAEYLEDTFPYDFE
jgi:L-fuculose-phosphate aldolase